MMPILCGHLRTSRFLQSTEKMHHQQIQVWIKHNLRERYVNTFKMIPQWSTDTKFLNNIYSAHIRIAYMINNAVSKNTD